MADPTNQTEPRIDAPTGTGFVGHEWDGIEELDTPMPRWWLWTFYLTIIWATIYVVLYPAAPLIDRASSGVLGWSSRGQLAGEMQAVTNQRAPMLRAIAAMPIADLPGNTALMTTAIAGGASAFKVHCVQCHGSGGAGVAAQYPSLIDDEWLWGGDLASIEQTLVHGIRNPDHATTRISQMPAFGRDGILTAPQIQDLVSHVRVISGQERASTSSVRGGVLFAENCAVCHGARGTGDRTVGAPDLTNRIWLYGGSRAAIAATIHAPRNGVMPRWGERLDAATIRMLAAYVHSLGGGEAAPVANVPGVSDPGPIATAP